MKKLQLAFALAVATGLAAAPFAAQAKSHKKHHSSMSQTTTGANMKSKGSDTSGQGTAAPGADQSGTMSTNKSAPSTTK